MTNPNGGHWIRTGKRHAIYARDGHRCVWCGRGVKVGKPVRCAKYISPSAATLDHLIPRAHGGSNGARNLVTSCLGCNSRRGDASALTWAMQVAKGRGLAGVDEILGRIMQLIDRPLKLPHARKVL